VLAGHAIISLPDIIEVIAMLKKEIKHIDITHIPELLRLAEEVQKSNQLTVLIKDGEEVLEVRPAKPSKRRSKAALRAADYEAFRSAAGGWKGLVDTEALMKDIMASRGSDRPPVNL